MNDKVKALCDFGWALLIDRFDGCLLAKQTRTAVFFMHVTQQESELLRHEQALQLYGAGVDERVSEFRVNFN